MRFFPALFVLTSIPVLLTGCGGAGSVPVGKPLAQQTYESGDVYTLRVADVSIVDSGANIASLDDFVVVPVDALKTFLEKQLKPEGLSGTLEVQIEKAMVTHEKTLSENRFNRLLKVGGFDVYTVNIDLSLVPVSDRGMVTEGRRINLSRTISVSEHSSLAEREALQMKTINALMNDLEAALGKNLGIMNMMMPRLTFPQ